MIAEPPTVFMVTVYSYDRNPGRGFLLVESVV